MMRNIYTAVAITVLSLVASGMVFAQFRTSVTMLSSIDDNAFRNSLAQGDNITTMALSLDYQPGESNFRLSYTGTANLFRTNSARQYFSNSLGASYLKPFGENEENAWNVGGTYFVRLNKEQYNYYDFNQLIASAGLKYYIDSEGGLLARTGYRLRYRGYSNLSEFSYIENFGYASLSKFFETKTTAIAELAVGNKRYVSSTMTTTASSSGSNGDSGGMMGEHGGWGEWGGSGGENQMMASSMNDGMIPGARVISYGSPSTTQLIGTVRLAQSLSPTTGVSVQFLRRWDISERTRFLSSGAVDFQGDEELWDDPYGYQSYEYDAGLTQVLPWELSARFNVGYFVKDYTRRVFLATDTDVPTGPLRDDTRLVGGINVRKSFDDGWIFFSGITVNASYFYVRNDSNDPYYNFTNNSFALGVSTQF